LTFSLAPLASESPYEEVEREAGKAVDLDELDRVAGERSQAMLKTLEAFGLARMQLSFGEIEPQRKPPAHISERAGRN